MCFATGSQHGSVRVPTKTRASVVWGPTKTRLEFRIRRLPHSILFILQFKKAYKIARNLLLKGEKEWQASAYAMGVTWCSTIYSTLCGGAVVCVIDPVA